MTNKIIASGRYDSERRNLFCSQTDDGKLPVASWQHPEPGVTQIAFDDVALGKGYDVTVLATSAGMSGTIVTEASAFVRHVSREGCEIVTAVFDRRTSNLVLRDSDFRFSIISMPSVSAVPAK